MPPPQGTSEWIPEESQTVLGGNVVPLITSITIKCENGSSNDTNSCKKLEDWCQYLLAFIFLICPYVVLIVCLLNIIKDQCHNNHWQFLICGPRGLP